MSACGPQLWGQPTGGAALQRALAHAGAAVHPGALPAHQRTIHNLAELAKELPDELLAILQPEHVVQWRYAHLLRSDPKTDTFILFAFDEACIAPLTLVPMPQRSHSLLASPT